MLINLTDYFKNTEKADALDVEFNSESIDLGYIKYPVTSSGIYRFEITNNKDGKVKILVKGFSTVLMPCDRCLLEVERKVSVDSEFVLDEPSSYEENEEEAEAFLNGYELDSDLLIHNELTMGLPMKVLCKDDCKGLCPVCGRNRNEGDCGCDTFVPDPRMAAIQDIFNAHNKEV